MPANSSAVTFQRHYKMPCCPYFEVIAVKAGPAAKPCSTDSRKATEATAKGAFMPAVLPRRLFHEGKEGMGEKSPGQPVLS